MKQYRTASNVEATDQRGTVHGRVQFGNCPVQQDSIAEHRWAFAGPKYSAANEATIVSAKQPHAISAAGRRSRRTAGVRASSSPPQRKQPGYDKQIMTG